MDNQPQFNDALYEKALEAAKSFTPESIRTFQELGAVETECVIRVLMAQQPKPKKRRVDAGTKRGPKVSSITDSKAS